MKLPTMKLFDFVSEEMDRPKVDACKGLIFRASVTQWFNCNGIGETVRLRKLKRKSCTGCEGCDYYEEFFNDCPDDIHLADLEHGKVYSIGFDTSEDWESGHIEIDAIVFNEVK